MKRALLISAAAIVGLVILLAAAGPIMDWLGVRPPFYIVISPGHVRVVRATAEPASLPTLTLGPLTNVAEAIEAHPELVDNLSGITIMGGAVGVPGNVRASADVGNDLAEWNVYVDPHALAVALGSGAPIMLVPLDATRYVPVTPGFYKELKRDR